VERVEPSEPKTAFTEWALANAHNFQSFCPPLLHKTGDVTADRLIDAINHIGREGWAEFEKQMEQGGHAEIQIPDFDRF